MLDETATAPSTSSNCVGSTLTEARPAASAWPNSLVRVSAEPGFINEQAGGTKFVTRNIPGCGAPDHNSNVVA